MGGPWLAAAASLRTGPARPDLQLPARASHKPRVKQAAAMDTSHDQTCTARHRCAGRVLRYRADNRCEQSERSRAGADNGAFPARPALVSLPAFSQGLTSTLHIHAHGLPSKSSHRPHARAAPHAAGHSIQLRHAHKTGKGHELTLTSAHSSYSATGALQT